jgi:transposase
MIKKICKLYKEGVSIKVLVTKYNITQGIIKRWVKEYKIIKNRVGKDS